MPDQSVDQLRESVLIALAFVEANLRGGATDGGADRELLLSVYTRDRINEGGYLLAGLLINFEATLLGIDPVERIAQLRLMAQITEFEED